MLSFAAMFSTVRGSDSQSYKAVLLGCGISLGLLSGCLDYGKVEQGRVIAFDETRRVVTLVRDISDDPQNPDYRGMPPELISLPEDPSEVGALPASGKLLKVDVSAKTLTVMDESAQALKPIEVTIQSLEEDVGAKDPRVYDRAAKAAKPFPVLEREKRTLTLYLKKEKTLLTVVLPEEAATLPDETWKMGDEVRLYYKEPGKSLRFMNITRTDIYAK